jgi:hypothetical protein
VFYLEARGLTEPTGEDRDRQLQSALTEALRMKDLPPVKFAYGPTGVPRAEWDKLDTNVSSLKVTGAETRPGGRLAVTLAVERQERDYLRRVLLQETGLSLRLSWEGRSFALDRLQGRVEVPSRLQLAKGRQVQLIEPATKKLEVLVVAGPQLWHGREGDTAEVSLRYQLQEKTLTFRKGKSEPVLATFDLVTEDGGEKPILRVQYRTSPSGRWIEAESPVVVIP